MQITGINSAIFLFDRWNPEKSATEATGEKLGILDNNTLENEVTMIKRKTSIYLLLSTIFFTNLIKY